MKPIFTIALLLLLTLLVSACSVHKIDVQQGNVITQELVEKLAVGMEKEQIKRLLGTPAIEDPFHKDRWDYIYRFVTGATGEVQSGHLSLSFKEDQLATIDVLKVLPKESEIKTPSLIRE